ncbi:NAD(P)H-hydrate dehydratase [Marinovum sp. KMM 9989]
MSELLTGAQMRAIEQAAINSGDVTGCALMERAGAGVVEAVFEEWPALGQGGHRAVVLCGPGNNGGDGFVIARRLHARGWEVAAFLLGDPERLPPDARTNYQRWREIGAVLPLPAQLGPMRGATVIVDALFGTGLTRPLRDLGLLLLDLQNSRGLGADIPVGERPDRTPLLVSVDVPSGLCADSGRVLVPEESSGLPDRLEAACVTCDLTVSFHALKLGHVVHDGPSTCGKVVVKDIGLRHARDAEVAKQVVRPSASALSKQAGHKFSNGHALVVSGGFGKTGAARLAARGALRIGAGLVTLGVPGSAQIEVASQITALMLQRVEDGAGLARVLEDARINALCLGPGLGLERARELVPVALACGGAKPRPTVLDADALSAFEDDPATLFTMLHGLCVLTPHGGEFARLFPDIAAHLGAAPTRGPAYSKADAVRDAAARAGCVVLLKGPATVMADPSGRCSVHAAVYDRAAPWLATAGSGDVLAGFITGLLARGVAPMQAAKIATWTHVECARKFGPGLIAEDLPEVLPQVLRDLGP